MTIQPMTATALSIRLRMASLDEGNKPSLASQYINRISSPLGGHLESSLGKALAEQEKRDTLHSSHEARGGRSVDAMGGDPSGLA